MAERVLVASTVAAYKADDERSILSWLAHADDWFAHGHEFFCAVQTGHGHDSALNPLLERLDGIGATVWRFALDENANRIGSAQRFAGICMGRNLAHEYAQRSPHLDAVLFIDTDIRPPADAIDKLLEIDRPLVGFRVPTYGFLNGPPVANNVGADLRQHWCNAGSLMVRKEAFRVLRWRWDIQAGQTDDPCFADDAIRCGFGPTVVRHDVIGRHYPQTLWPFEMRGHDLTVRTEGPRVG